MIERTLAFEDLVIGGGAVGLFAALTLTATGRAVGAVGVVDAAPRRRGNTYSVPLHPGTLERFAAFGLLPSIEAASLPVPHLTWWHRGARAAALRFDRPAAAKGAVALRVVPLDRLEAALERRVAAAGVAVRRGLRVERMAEDGAGVNLDLADTITGERFRCRADRVIGADGCGSATRTAAGIAYRRMGPTETYLVFEGPAPDPAPAGIEVLIHDGMASSVWPLPGGRWRGNLRVPPGAEPTVDPQAPADRRRLAEWLATRSGGRYPDAPAPDWLLEAPFELRLAAAFSTARVVVAGDAAHSAGPTAAHSLNRGFLEVEDLVRARGRGPVAVREADARHRAAWRPLFGGAGPATPPGRGTAGPGAGPDAWPVNWLDTLPASGAHLERLLAHMAAGEVTE